MAIIKVLKRENPYIQIDRIGIDDSNLSWEATGLLIYLIGRPHNWKINISHLSSVKQNKETSTRNALLELRKAKYCHYFEIRKSGKVVETFYLVFEVPTEYEEIKNSIDFELKEGEKIFYKELEKNKNISSKFENQQTAKTKKNSIFLPKVEKLKTEKLKVENQALINIDINNNRMNIKKNHNDNLENDDLNKIKELFIEIGIDFSRRHKKKVLELLKKNSADFLCKHFRNQYEILKKKKNVKSIPAIMSKYLFKDTCEIDSIFVENKEKENPNLKKKEQNINDESDKVLETFFSLPIEEQLSIENEVLANNLNIDIKLKSFSSFIFYKMIAKDIKNYLNVNSLN